MPKKKTRTAPNKPQFNIEKEARAYLPALFRELKDTIKKSPAGIAKIKASELMYKLANTDKITPAYDVIPVTWIRIAMTPDGQIIETRHTQAPPNGPQTALQAPPLNDNAQDPMQRPKADE